MADQTTAALLDPALADATDGPVVLAARLHQLGKRRTARHRHARGQLLGAYQGLLRIAADDLHWLLPAGHVAWIPPLLPHALLGADGFNGWSL
ncbi:AraC family ligand binding domain-containing protein, partial [Raoultella ornithinolytica]